jgi:membrane associated rhomboid family serine protease
MSRASDRRAFLLSTDNPSLASVVEQALREAGIPFETGVQVGPEPAVVFTVSESDVPHARAVVEQHFGTGPLSRAEPAAPEESGRGRAGFPEGPVAAAASLVLVHLAIVALAVGRHPDPARLASAGGLVTGARLPELWRLLTSLFLHADAPHVLWNGLSMLVFAVPLIERLGWTRSASVYLASGVLGGLAALAGSEPGTVTIGSSGAVAGLFGCWVVSTVRLARRAPLARRGVVRAVGIGLLLLPSLLTPTTIGGNRISVAAHLGGLAAGLVFGATLPVGREEPRSVSGSGTNPGDAPSRGPTSRSSP